MVFRRGAAAGQWLALALGSAALVAGGSGCLADVPSYVPGTGSNTNGQPGPGPAPVPANVQGLVTSPTNGQLYTGTTTQTPITVSGTYTGSSTNVSVEMFDPTLNPPAWTSVGAAAVQSQAFTTIVGPFNALQWPQGGVLALRVVDDSGSPLPYQLNNDRAYANTSVVVGSPGQNPTDWNFLTQAPLGNTTTTADYYNFIGAPRTLTDFQTAFFPQGLTAAGAQTAYYYNKGDLAVGRALSCNTTPVRGVACFVEALGSFDGDENTALHAVEQVAAGNSVAPVATVAMIYNPPITNTNAVQFIVYDGNGNLQDFAKLDSGGANTSVPQNCLNCHGAQATFDAGHLLVSGAQFLQLDPLAMDFAQRQGLTFAAQQTAMFQMEQLVAEASPPPTTRNLIAGEWAEEGGVASFNPDFVPGEWNTTQRDANLYTQAIAPFCRGCHASVVDDSAGLAFQSPRDFLANATKIVNEICGAGPAGMPVAQATSTRFFSSIAPGCNEAGCKPSNLGNVTMSARALILEYLGQSTTTSGCALGQNP
jgi:hypothetical protein